MWQRIKELFSSKLGQTSISTQQVEQVKSTTLPVAPVTRVSVNSDNPDQLAESTSVTLSEPVLVAEKALQTKAKKHKSVDRRLPSSDSVEDGADALKPAYDLNTAIRQKLAPALRADGFVGSGRNFRKIQQDWLTILNIETSRSGDAFTLNIGVHPCAFPDVLGRVIEPKKMKVQLCEFRTRLSAEEGVFEWKLATGEAAIVNAVEQALSCYQRTCREQLAYLTGAESPFVHATLDDYAKGVYDFSPFDARDIRTPLVIARLHHFYQRTEIAREFAQYGLQHVGNSVGVRREFEVLLEA